MTIEPQNPYASYVVDASAGSGKTYQLSKRFLFLVGAHAHPSSILTVTFTNKAVEEMRARIVKEASILLSHKENQKEFDTQIQKFYNA